MRDVEAETAKIAFRFSDQLYIVFYAASFRPTRRSWLFPACTNSFRCCTSTVAVRRLSSHYFRRIRRKSPLSVKRSALVLYREPAPTEPAPTGRRRKRQKCPRD